MSVENETEQSRPGTSGGKHDDRPRLNFTASGLVVGARTGSERILS
jgi:hypothetical protein